MVCRFVLAACMLCICASIYAQEQKDEPSQPPPPPTAEPGQPTQKIHVGQGVTQGFLIKRVQPEYPSKARKRGVQGAVVLRVVITKTGDVEDVEVISGDELLVPATVKAVKKWKYKPYLLKGEPVAIKTTITFNFQRP